MIPEEIKKILNIHVKKGVWQLKDSSSGKSKTSYIGIHNDQKVFIKLESANEALKRLATIGITPTILYVNQQIIIQEFIEGSHPIIDWITNNYKEFANIIKKYHSDDTLKTILKKNKPSSYERILESFLREVKDWKQQVDDFVKNKEARQHLEKLISGKPTNIIDPSVPIHADPNISNFILHKTKIFIVDWDDIKLSDPMCDIGQFLWNYVPQDKWEAFFNDYSLELTNERKYRLFWWISIMKLFVGFWFYIYQKETVTYKKYLEESIMIADKYLWANN